MTQEQRDNIEREAEEKYPVLRIWHSGVGTSASYIDDNKLERKAYIAGATHYASKLEEAEREIERYKAIAEAKGKVIAGSGKEIEKLDRLVDLKESERKEWAEMCIKKQAEIERLKDALIPLAYLDLTGVTGDVVYQRNKSAILKFDVRKAWHLLNPLPSPPSK